MTLKDELGETQQGQSARRAGMPEGGWETPISVAQPMRREGLSSGRRGGKGRKIPAVVGIPSRWAEDTVSSHVTVIKI